MSSFKEYLAVIRGMDRNAHLFLGHTILFGASIALLSLLYNLYVLSLGFKTDMIGIITLAACTVAVVAALPLGFVLNRLGYQRALILAVLLTAFSMALPLVIPTSEALIGCELFWGVGFTLLVIAGGPFMTENSTAEQRAHLFSLQFVLTTITAFVGNLIGGDLPRWFAEWFQVGAESAQAYRGALGVSAALMLASMIPFLFLARRPHRYASASRPRLTITHRAHTARLILPFVVGALGAGMFVPFANVLWRNTQNVSDGTIGNIFALSALVTAFVGVLSPFLIRRFGHVRVTVFAQAISVIGLLAFGLSPIFGIALIGYLVRDVLMNMTRPIVGQFMMDQSEPMERAGVSAFATMGFNLAWGVSSWVSGVWQTQEQLIWVFVASAGFFVLSNALLYRFFDKSNQAPITRTAPQAVQSIAASEI